MTILIVWTLALAVQAPATPAQATAPPPDTEVFLAPLSIQGARIEVGPPMNISNSPGYDNQPSFSPDGSSIYFTSARGPTPPAATAPQMDIYRYVIASKRTEAVTRTPESEYSATVTPGGDRISVIRVEADGTQRLWSFGIDGAGPKLLLADVKPVGYHAWLDANTLVLFVLGQPATLQVADVRTGAAQVAARDIGRSLQQIPGGGVSFVQRADDAGRRTMTISEVSVEAGKPLTRAITAVAPGATDEYVVWTPSGALLMAAGGKLYAWRRAGTWTPVADLTALGLTAVTRLAISPKGDWLALVAQSSTAR